MSRGVSPLASGGMQGDVAAPEQARAIAPGPSNPRSEALSGRASPSQPSSPENVPDPRAARLEREVALKDAYVEELHARLLLAERRLSEDAAEMASLKALVGTPQASEETLRRSRDELQATLDQLTSRAIFRLVARIENSLQRWPGATALGRRVVRRLASH
jgi:hypothetical protein